MRYCIMKKGTSIFLFLITFLGITLFSCKLEFDDTNLYDKPGVDLSDKQVTLIIPKVNSKTKYLNVYRRDKETDVVTTIALLNHPLALLNDNKNYRFIDKLIKDGHSYDYRVRYNIDGEYYYTKWSDVIEIKASEFDSCYFESVNLTFKTTGVSLKYNKDKQTIEINGTIVEPDFPEYITDSYYPMLIIQSETATQTFALPSIASGTTLPLLGLLPPEFQDTELTINGIVGQKMIFDDDSKPIEDRLIKEVIWTEPTAIKVTGVGSSQKIVVPSQLGTDGFDYSASIY